MYVAINKQLIRLQNCHGVLLGFASEVSQDVALKCLRTGHALPTSYGCVDLLCSIRLSSRTRYGNNFYGTASLC